MATPRAAQHRDLEQRLRDLESKVRELTGVALRRQQLSVTSGDFVVSGGGAVVVQDGGGVRVDYASGSPAVQVTDQYSEGEYAGTGLLVERDGGGRLAWMGESTDGGASVELWDNTGHRILANDGTTGMGLAIPHLQYPMANYEQRSKTTSTSWQPGYFGGIEVWHPYLDIAVPAKSAADNEVDVRVLLDGANINGSPQTVVGGSATLLFRADLRALTFGSTHTLEIDLRRRGAGTGAVTCYPYYVRGGQS
ncbi:hypothetical protein [Nocardioides donggukensis]|uniref:Uncharacterized protein n=1 Tax=Nocardioides donggukensis TaxID=2774019 RepID=A0A927Q0T3_9ACTN|nr:hypothetical protein [Nocardioides donggukensis]MBD8869297.1 hypothetical protein [Nocardioides donggukensis]